MQTCPDCQSQVEEKAIFCDHCGYRLKAEGASPNAGGLAPPFQPGWPQGGMISAAVQMPGGAEPGNCTFCGHNNLPGEAYCQNCGMDLTIPFATHPPERQPLPPFPATPEVVAQGGQVGAASRPGVAGTGTCSACGHMNAPGEMFCQRCGVQLAPVASVPPPPPKQLSPGATESSAVGVSAVGLAGGSCPNCAHINPPGEEFCQNCGLQLSTAVHLPSNVPSSSPYSSGVGQAVPGVAGFVPTTTPVIQPDALGGSPAGKFVVRTTNLEIPIPAGKTEILLGRNDPGANIFPEIDLTGHNGEIGGVSRRHAHLSLQAGVVYIEDLNSTNFTFLNRQKLQPGQPHVLKHGDEVRLGAVVLIYQAV